MIDIDNEEQILKECDFDYYYECYACSRELCMFYNDIFKQPKEFDKRQAFIDLGRIGITINKQHYDKITFAIEQLEKVKTRMKNRIEDWNVEENYQLTDMLPDYDIYEEIDNQIEELKKENNL